MRTAQGGAAGVSVNLQACAVTSTSVVGQKRKSSVGFGMSVVGGKAEVDFGRPDVSL